MVNIKLKMLSSLFDKQKSSFSRSIQNQSSKPKTPKRPSSKQSAKDTPTDEEKQRTARLQQLAQLKNAKPTYDFTKTTVPPSRDVDINTKGIRKSYRFGK